MRPSIVILALASVASLSLPGPATAQWEEAVVVVLAGSEQDERSNRFSLAMDADDVPHAIWAVYPAVHYSHGSEAGDWIAPIPIGADDVIYTDHAIAMAPGATDPMVLCSRRAIGETTGDLLLAVWNGAGFDEIPLTNDELGEHMPALAVDADGHYHVVCASEVDSVWRLRYLTNVTGEPTDELVDAGSLGGFGSGAGPAIAVQADGRVRITYRGVSGGYRIHHAMNDAPGGTSWTWNALITPNQEDLSADIAIDSTGGAHVAVSGSDCFGCSPRTYYLHQPPGAPWAPPVFIPLTTGLTSPSLAVDDADLAHVAMAEVVGNIYTGRLYYASAASGWAPVLIIGTDHGAPSLAVGRQGYGHLVCTTGPNTGIEDVLYIRSESVVVGVGEPDPDPVPPGVRLLAYPNPFTASVTFTLAGSSSADPDGWIRIHDATGRQIRRLSVDPRRIETAAVEWDGRDDAGIEVAPGVYFAHLVPGSSSRRVKVVRGR